MVMPTVSLIINTLDRAATLKDALAACAQLRDVRVELIVVNGPSTDETAAVLDAWQGRIKRLSCPDANLARSRNIGIAAAAGEFVAFLDDDAAPHPYWLQRLLPLFEDPAVAATGGYTVGRGGVSFQTRKIVADRFGNATMMSDFFDERGLCRPKSALVPAPMGTNVMFRRAALAAIGGFDETYSYFLEETDVCVRLVDAGWVIRFEPSAFVWHQFAQSALRTSRDIPRGLRPLARSKAYFIGKWGHAGAESDAALAGYLDDKLGLLSRLHGDGVLHAQERLALMAEVKDGLAEGTALAARRPSGATAAGDWAGEASNAAFLPLDLRQGMTIALICRHFPPGGESGIGRWSEMLAQALTKRGHRVHVVCEGRDGASITYRDGLWRHEVAIAPENNEPDIGLPTAAAAFAHAARRQVEAIKSFGLDVISFPIWDVEGAALLGDTDVPVVMSLHTTFGLSLPWRKDWRDDPLFRAEVAEPMRAAEAYALQHADLLLANSHAIVDDIAADTGLALKDRAFIAPHGVDISDLPPKNARAASSLTCLFVGRHEGRKGPDIALGAVSKACAAGRDVHLVMAGCTEAGLRACLEPPHIALLDQLMSGRAVTLQGVVPRAALDAMMRDADVVLVPSRYESFGLVAAEAMAQGTPVIASAVGGLSEVIEHDLTGYLVPLDDAEAGFAAKIIELADSAARQQELSIGAWRSAREAFSTDVMAEAVEQGYAEAVRRYKSGRGAKGDAAHG